MSRQYHFPAAVEIQRQRVAPRSDGEISTAAQHLGAPGHAVHGPVIHLNVQRVVGADVPAHDEIPGAGSWRAQGVGVDRADVRVFAVAAP